MGNFYVDSSKSNANNGLTWATAKATLAAGLALAAAGDTVWVAPTHSESTAGGLTFATNGTLTNPVRVICAGSTAAEPPTSVATTAVIVNTGTNNINISGTSYWYGIDFTAGSGAGSTLFNLNNSASHKIKYERCKFRLGASGSSGLIILGTQISSNANETELLYCDYKFAANTQGIAPQGRVRMYGGTILSGGTSPNNLITSGGLLSTRPLDCEIVGLDLTNASSSMNLAAGGTTGSGGKCAFINIKKPGSWSGSLVGTAVANPGATFELRNQDQFWVENYGGSVKSETSIVRSGGSRDGTTPFSQKLVSAAAVSYPCSYLQTSIVSKWNDTTGSSVTATIEGIFDSATNIKDNQIWARFDYLSDSGSLLATVIEDITANVVTSAADQDSSSATWNNTGGMTNPNKFKLAASFTPQQKGYVAASVFLAKPSTTAYLDGKVTLS